MDLMIDPNKKSRKLVVLNSNLMKEVMDESGNDDSGKEDNRREEEGDGERSRKRALGQETPRHQNRNKNYRERDGGFKRSRQNISAIEEASLANQQLIDIIKYKGKLAQLAASKWVERYEANPDDALEELLTMFFLACGIDPKLPKASLIETDVDDVVQFLVLQAKDGSLDDYLRTKQRDIRNFKESLLTFWDSLVRECQDSVLFDQKVMEKCMDYVIAISCTAPRIFRHVATLVGLQLVSSLVTVARSLSASRETAQRQLNAEKKKMRDGTRVESLIKTLSETHSKITLVEEMMRKIFTGLFMHRYRDVDPDIRMSCITAIGFWIVAYPSLFLQDLYLKYIGWTLNDKNAAVRRSSIGALQSLYAEDDNIPSLGLFTERFRNRMIELADDVDVSVAVSAIGLLKQLLRHQLLEDDDLGPLYEILIDEVPQIRYAVGDLVYDHLIAPVSGGVGNENLEGQLERLLQILREFSRDGILCDYVIDALWDKCRAMKDWKLITSMLLEDRLYDEHRDTDATNLVRVLSASVKKAVGQKILPVGDHRKGSLNKAQKELYETSRKEMTTVMIRNISKLLRKCLADKAKAAAIVEVVLHMNMELYSLQRKEQNFTNLMELIKEAFFKHDDNRTLKACVESLSFAAQRCHADLQDSAQHILKQTVDHLILKLEQNMEKAGDPDDAYSLTVNLRRLYHLQVGVNVPCEALVNDMLSILEDFNNLDDEVVRLIFLNIFMHIVWCFSGIDPNNPDELAVGSLLGKRTRLLTQLEVYLEFMLNSTDSSQMQSLLSCTICSILSDTWSLFSEAKLMSTKLHALGCYPQDVMLQKFWALCEQRLVNSDDTRSLEDELSSDYVNEKDLVMTAAAKLIVHDMVAKDYLGPEILSHYVLHGKTVAETVKQLLSTVKQQMKPEDLADLYLNSMIRAHRRHMDQMVGVDEDAPKSASYVACKELAHRLSTTFLGMARPKYRSSILNIVKGGINYAFLDLPRHLSFLSSGVIQFALKLPATDIREILADVSSRIEGIDTDQDPSGWRPFLTFVDQLRERCSRNEAPYTDKERIAAPQQTQEFLKRRGMKGKVLFEGHAATSDDEQEGEVDLQTESGELEEENDEDDGIRLFTGLPALKPVNASNTTMLSPGISIGELTRERSPLSEDDMEGADVHVLLETEAAQLSPNRSPAFY